MKSLSLALIGALFLNACASTPTSVDRKVAQTGGSTGDHFASVGKILEDYKKGISEGAKVYSYINCNGQEDQSVMAGFSHEKVPLKELLVFIEKYQTEISKLSPKEILQFNERFEMCVASSHQKPGNKFKVISLLNPYKAKAAYMAMASDIEERTKNIFPFFNRNGNVFSVLISHPNAQNSTEEINTAAVYANDHGKSINPNRYTITPFSSLYNGKMLEQLDVK